MHTPLTFELGKLEQVITKLVASRKEHQTYLFDSENDLSQTILNEANVVKKNFVHEVFNIEDELHLQRYIQFHQQELVRLHDLLESYHRAQQSNINQIESKDVAIAKHALEELLHFIERHFTNYFNLDAKAPESYIALTARSLVDAMHQYQEDFEKKDVDKNLITLALAPLRKFVEHTADGRLTYRDIIYVKEVSRELAKRLNSRNNALQEALRNTFLYLNYNTISYFNYYTGYILEQVKSVDNTPDKIEKLSYILKTINQVPVKPGIGYNSVYPALKQQLVDWISEEIAYQEKSFHFAQKLTSSGPLANDFKIQVDMSLSQLAYILRIFVDLKLIQNKNLSDILRFFSKSCQVKQQSISYESFRVRYYNPEDSVRKSVRSILLKLVDYINNS